MRFTTQKAALCHALLSGRILTIMDAFEEFGITNLPREIGRSVERSFGVVVNKWRCRHTNKFGEEGSHFVYEMYNDKRSMFLRDKSKRPAHRKGLKLMQKYVDEHTQHKRLIYPSKNISTIGGMPVKDDSHYVKTYPAFNGNELSAHYAMEAEKRSIPKNTRSTKEIIMDTLKDIEKVKKKLKNKKK